MPTPESEAFLAKKPKVPPTFDGVDYDDTPRLKQAQDTGAMGQEHDGEIGARGAREVLLSGGRKPSGEVWSSKR